MTLKLVWNSEGVEKARPVPAEGLTIGRAAECAIALADPRVSRVHARLELRDLEVWICDQGSQNGVKVNGRRIVEAPLRAGDAVVLGGTRLRLEECEGTGPSDRTETSVRVALPSDPAAGAMAEGLKALGRNCLSGDFFAEALGLAREAAGAERAYFLSIQKDGMRVVASSRPKEEEGVDPDFDLSWTIASRVAMRQEPVVLADAGADPRFTGKDSIETLSVRAVLGIPISSLGRPLGAMVFENRDSNVPFTEADRERLELLSAAIGGFWRTRLLAEEVKSQGPAEGRKTTVDSAEPPQPAIVGGGARMDELRHLIAKVAGTDLTVLIQGESGTGKELVARAIHALSKRKRRPFHVLNCAAIPETLLEAELFGHVRGAFTGAEEGRAGLFEEADGGTLFLDEVSEMSAGMQTRLLRVLQEGEVRPLGSSEVRKINVRVIAATNKDLQKAIADGSFREDLYFRLRVLPVPVPPLRDRKEDIPALVSYLFARHGGHNPPSISRDALDVLHGYRWPGNVRELENEVKRLCVVGGRVIESVDLAPTIREAGVMMVGKDSDFENLDTLVEAIETREIRKALERTAGNKTRASELLGITRFTLQRKLEKYGIDPDEL